MAIENAINEFNKELTETLEYQTNPVEGRIELAKFGLGPRKNTVDYRFNTTMFVKSDRPKLISEEVGSPRLNIRYQISPTLLGYNITEQSFNRYLEGRQYEMDEKRVGWRPTLKSAENKAEELANKVIDKVQQDVKKLYFRAMRMYEV